MVSFLSFLTYARRETRAKHPPIAVHRPLASSMFAPGVLKVMAEFGVDSDTLATFVVSVYVLGFAFGLIVVAPASERFGRSPIYHTPNALFMLFNICSALAVDMAMLVAFRFLAGFAGVTPITIGSGTIADMMPVEQRGLAISFWSLGPLFGPIIGPVIGGFLIEAQSWRWVFWVISICSAIAVLLYFVVLRESLPSVILEKKAKRLREATGSSDFQARDERQSRPQHVDGIIRPLKILLGSPIALLMSLYIAILYGMMYILFTILTFVFEGQYQFSTRATGLSFLGRGVGTLAGLACSAALSDRKIKQKIAKGEPTRPEDLLPLILTLPGSLSIPIGPFVYGWASAYEIHWIVPEIGTAIIGFGMIVVLMCVQTYLVDLFTVYVASAMAANTILRNLLGALLPLCGLSLCNAIGLGWGNTFLGCLALFFAPAPVLFGVFGERLRKIRGSQDEQ